MDALRFEDAAVGYAERAVLAGVDLTLAPGEVLGLVGPNGAGKTTILRAVTGGAVLLHGRLTIQGRPRADYHARELARVVGVLPQVQPQTFAFTVRRFVELGRHAHLSRLGELRASDHAAVDRALALTDTERLADVAVDTLSGGDLQRVTLAQALAQEPRVLLLDEPTSHLDVDHALQVCDLTRRLAAEGMAVLAVFHDLGLAARYSDRLGVVAEGGLSAVGAPRDVLTSARISRVFHVRAVVGTDVVTGAVSVTPVLRDEALARGGGFRVLVVSGASTGAALMRELLLAGYRVSAGALNRGDTDQAVAEVLGLERVDLPAFGEVDAKAERRVAAIAAEADAIVVSSTPFGAANIRNLGAAVGAHKPTVVVDAGEERDFCRGEARRYLAKLTAGGAVTVRSDAEALGALERMLLR